MIAARRKIAAKMAAQELGLGGAVRMAAALGLFLVSIIFALGALQ